MEDPQIEFQPRAMDAEWKYSNCIPRFTPGFNPWVGKIFYPANSRLQKWLKKPEASARALNEGDRLAFEVLFAVHDYLHHWAYLAINQLQPDLELGWGRITAKNIEDYAFCHILSEAAAVTGLDYWLMCTRSVNSFCSIGSRTESITVSYRENLLSEYRIFNPDFTVQNTDFFGFLAQFYCSGEFVGFDEKDLACSPQLERWLAHEVEYGETQRLYTRCWLNYLSRDSIPLNTKDASRPIAIDKPWKKRLVKDLGQLLWEKVKEEKLHRFQKMPNSKRLWTRDLNKPLDFRWINLNEVELRGFPFSEIWTNKSMGDLDLECFLKQWIFRHDYKSLDPAYSALIGRLFANNDIAGLAALLKGQKRLTSVGNEELNVMNLG